MNTSRLELVWRRRRFNNMAKESHQQVKFKFTHTYLSPFVRFSLRIVYLISNWHIFVLPSICICGGEEGCMTKWGKFSCDAIRPLGLCRAKFVCVDATTHAHGHFFPHCHIASLPPQIFFIYKTLSRMCLYTRLLVPSTLVLLERRKRQEILWPHNFSFMWRCRLGDWIPWNRILYLFYSCHDWPRCRKKPEKLVFTTSVHPTLDSKAIQGRLVTTWCCMSVRKVEKCST